MPSPPDSPSSASIVRKLSTILSADVAEFSRLMSEDEEQTLRTFRGHKKVFEALVATHRGRVFNTAGDAILAEFSSAVEAVRCATDIQSALRTRNDPLPPNRQVRFRIGINLGDVLIQGEDLLGDGVNVAARLQTAAEPGGICLSGSVHDQIRNKLSLTFQSLGERTYKNIAQPVRTFSVVEIDGGPTLPSPKPLAARNNVRLTAGIAAVALLLLGGGYWAYQKSAPNGVQTAQPVAQTAPSAAALLAPQPKSEETPAGSAQPTVAPPASSSGPPRKATPATSKTPSAAPVVVPASPAASTASPSAGKFDGVFGGPVCFAKTPREPERCFHAEGTIAGNRITGKWPVGPNSGLTMFLKGEVSPAGEVKMEMHSEKADGSRVATVDFVGAIQDRSLDADGKFRMGRPATLHWHKNDRASGPGPAAQH